MTQPPIVQGRQITSNGKIATLRKARKIHRCSECPYHIFKGDYYWEIVLAGAGLGSIKFPDRTHVGNCLEKNMYKGEPKQNG